MAISFRIFLLVASAVFLVDQLLKFVVVSIQSALPLKIIAGVFEITYAKNTGVAFGLFQGNNFLFILVGLGVVVLLLKYWNRFEGVAESAAASLILGGTLGNLSDRVFRGWVIDYVNVLGIPIFNFADAMLTVGAALIITVFLQEKLKLR